MSPKQSKHCILILSFSLAISLGANIYSLLYPLVQSRAANRDVAWIETVKKEDLIYPEVIPTESPILNIEPALVADPDMEAEVVVADIVSSKKEAVVESSVKESAALPVETKPTEVPVQATAEPQPTPEIVSVDEPTSEPEKTQQTSIQQNGETVYITKTGTKFHRGTCSSLSKSKIAISFEEACAKMYEPCGKCNP